MSRVVTYEELTKEISGDLAAKSENTWLKIGQKILKVFFKTVVYGLTIGISMIAGAKIVSFVNRLVSNPRRGLKDIGDQARRDSRRNTDIVRRENEGDSVLQEQGRGGGDNRGGGRPQNVGPPRVNIPGDAVVSARNIYLMTSDIVNTNRSVLSRIGSKISEAGTKTVIAVLLSIMFLFFSVVCMFGSSGYSITSIRGTNDVKDMAKRSFSGLRQNVSSGKSLTAAAGLFFMILSAYCFVYALGAL